MAYKFRKWSLYKGIVKIGDKNKDDEEVYFLSKRKTRYGVPCNLPKEYIVVVNERTGLPYLKKKE